MAAAFHYIVKSKLIRTKKDNKYEFLEFEDKFIEEEPILAREKAFNHYQNYIDVLLQSKGKSYISHNCTKEELKSFTDAEPIQFLNSEEASIELAHEENQTNEAEKNILENNEYNIIRQQYFEKISGSLYYFIGIYMVIDVPLSDENDNKGEQFAIHGIGFDWNDTDLLIYGLDDEFKYYKKNKYNTNNKEIRVTYCNSSEWEDGYLGNGKWEDSYHEPNTYQILETPFDWTGYDKPYWWRKSTTENVDEINDVDEVEEISEIEKIKHIIQGGESEYVEFKPALHYNFKTNEAGISIKNKIAITICSFLNSKGGFLFIGLNDDGSVQGLDKDFSLSDKPNARDYFQNQFDDTIRQFLSFSVKSNITGKFQEIEDKTIFFVCVTPSQRPVFLKKPKEKEFWVRGNAGNNKLDIEQTVNYCFDKWGPK